MQKHLNPLGVYAEMIELRQNFVLSKNTFINFIYLNDTEKKIVHQWRNNPDIRKWMRSGHVIEYKEHLNFIKKLENDKKNFYWLVKSENQYLGIIYLNNVNSKDNSAYLGIYANPQLKGVGHRLMASLKELSFNLCRLCSLKLEVMEINQRAIDFYKKSGFTKKKQACEDICKDGKQYSVIMMTMLNDRATRVC